MAARRLVLKRSAERDLTEQAEFIAREQPAAARRYLIAAERAFDRLLEMPELGERRPFKSAKLKGLRMWPIPGFRNFLIFYRVTQGSVQVVRVLHGAQDVSNVLGDKSRRARKSS